MEPESITIPPACRAIAELTGGRGPSYGQLYNLVVRGEVRARYVNRRWLLYRADLAEIAGLLGLMGSQGGQGGRRAPAGGAGQRGGAPEASAGPAAA